MDFVNKALQQVTELFRQLTPGARLMAGLLSLTIVVALVFLFRGESQTADEYLFGGEPVPHRELANMEAVFAKVGLKGQQIEGNRMKVPRGKKDAYLKALYDNDAMPSTFTSAPRKAIDKDNPFSSKDQRQSAMKLAKEEQLAKIVSAIKGIEEASVMYDETDTATFPRRKERRATVAVRALGSRGLSDEEIKTVRHTVMGAVGGLKPSDVTVVDMNGGRAFPGGEGPSGNASDSVYAMTKKVFEQQFRDKIYDRLVMYPGVVVGVNVELDPELNHSTESLKFGPKPIPISTTTLEKSTPIAAKSDGGRPGAAPNAIGNSAQAVSTPVAASDPATENRSEQRLVSSHEQIVSQKAPLVPNRVTASVDVPNSYFVKVWKERNADEKDAKDKAPDPADLKKIEEETRKNIETAVLALLPPATGDQKVVTVTSFTEIPEPPFSKPGVAEKATSWFGANWQTVAMIGLGFFSLVFLKGMLKPPPEPAPAVDAATAAAAALKIAEGTEADAHEGDEQSEEQVEGKRGFRVVGPNLRADLANIVQQDPDTAANILKAWIGDVA